MVQPLWKTVWQFIQKLRIELPFDPAILLCVHCSIFHSDQNMKTTKVSLDKGDVVHIYNILLLSHKKNKILPFVTT